MPDTPPPETPPDSFVVTPPDPFVVTLRLDAPLFATLDALRRQHFPPERNVVPAHISLYHALPGAESAAVRRALTAVSETTAPFPILLYGLRSLGRGVAIDVAGGAPLGDTPVDVLDDLLRRLSAAVVAQVGEGALTLQDRQRTRPHVTIQNKVTPAVARETLKTLEATFKVLFGRAEGIDLWRYRGGPWQHVRTFPFRRAVTL